MRKFLLLLLACTLHAQNITQPPPTPQQRNVSLPAFVPQYLPPYPAGAGLKVYVSGGNIVSNGIPIYISSQYVYLQPNTTTYVYVDMVNGVIAQSSSGFPTTAYPVCSCTTNGTIITNLGDSRPDVFGGGSGGGTSNVFWNNILPAQGNLNLSQGTNTTSLLSGDFGTGPAAYFWNLGDTSVSNTDNTTNLNVGTGNNSWHQPFTVSLTTSGSTFDQLQVCNLGNSHIGITVVGNILPCPPSGSYPGLPGNTGVSGVSKLTVMDNTSNHSQLRLWQNNNSNIADQFQINTAGTYNVSTNPFYSMTVCTGGTQFVSGSSFGNGLCGGSNPGTVVFYVRGDGQVNATNYIGPVWGVTFSNPPSSATGYICILISQTNCTWQPNPGGGGGTGAQYQTAVFSGINAIGAVGPGKSGQPLISTGNASNPAYTSAGVPGSTVSTAGPYLGQCDSSTATIDRLTTIRFTFSGTATLTVPDPTDTGCGNNFTFAVVVATGTTLTVNRETAGTFTTLTGGLYTSGLTTFSLTAGQFATFNAVSSTEYIVRITTAVGANLLVTGILDGKAPVTVTTSATASLGGTYNSGYTFNQEATAATAITYTLPTAAAGKQYCVSNSYNGSAATTGTLKIQTSASGQFIIDASGTLSATGGYVISNGVAADAACVVGVDATHWQLYVNRGSWTTH